MNKTFLSIAIFLTLGLFLIFFTSQTFAQVISGTKEAIEQTFGKENHAESNNQMNDNATIGFTMEDLYPEKKLAQDFANKSLTEGMSEELKGLVKYSTEQSPEYKAKQALTYKYNELQEKYYVECIVHKESGEFKNTIDCMTWSHDNAQIQLGLN